MPKLELIHGDLTQRIIGAFYDVFGDLGAGHLEVAYQRAMQMALEDIGIPCQREVPTTVYFRGRSIGNYRMDMIVESRVIIECKTVDRIVAGHRAQLINYLKSTEHEVGLILNFGQRPSFERVVYERLRKQ